MDGSTEWTRDPFIAELPCQRRRAPSRCSKYRATAAANPGMPRAEKFAGAANVRPQTAACCRPRLRVPCGWRRQYPTSRKLRTELLLRQSSRTKPPLAPGHIGTMGPAGWRCCGAQSARSMVWHRGARSCRRKTQAKTEPTVTGNVTPSRLARRAAPASASAPQGLTGSHVRGQATQRGEDRFILRIVRPELHAVALLDCK